VAGAAPEGRPFVAALVLRLGRANAARLERACGARFSSSAPAMMSQASRRFDQLKETA
jgi:hypothetical protein